VGRVGILACIASAFGCGRIYFDPLDDGGALPLTCPPRYDAVAGHCYRLDELDIVTDTWRGLELVCEADGPGTHLAVIDDAAELAILIEHMRINTNQDAAIGFSDRGGGVYRTVLGAPAFEQWASGQPTAAGCGALQRLPDEGMVMIPCQGIADFDSICEYDGIPPDPSSF
jgi:hypothetical protein